jgi:hypothetical protein
MNIIFYYPDNITSNPKKGSEVRPYSMLTAFLDLGYKVDVVKGDSSQRKIKLKLIKDKIKKGHRYDFFYGESTNQTFFLSDANHFPRRPLLDIYFFKFLKKNKVPLGIFYRDAYWCLSDLRPRTNFKYLVKYFFHRIEWTIFNKYFDVIYFPSFPLLNYLPKTNYNFKSLELYPGHNNQHIENDINNESKLNLIYVGGVKPPYYDLTNLLNATLLPDSIKLNLCTREDEWNEYGKLYSCNQNNLKLYFVNSNDLKSVFQKSDIFVDLRISTGYFKIAMPIKYFESIGYETPVICMAGHYISEFVLKHNVGWVLNNISDFEILLKKINTNRSILEEKIIEIKKIKSQHSWSHRTLEVKNSLYNVNF